MSDYILRYYYFLKEETALSETLADVLKQHSFSAAGSCTQAYFQEQTSFYYHFTDSSGKMNILGAKVPAAETGWAGAWEHLQAWEKEAGLSPEDLMGRLTVLVAMDKNWPLMLQEAGPLLSCSDVECSYSGVSPLFRLSTANKDNEAIYIYTPDGRQEAPVPLLTRTLPVLHGQIIFLSELDLILSERNCSIIREKETLENDLIRILHIKLVMNNPSLSVNEELENDIEVLATAFAKLVGDKKLISDGIRRLDASLKKLEQQIQREPVFNLNEDMFQELLGAYQERLTALSNTYDDLSLAEDNYQSAITVVQSKIQVMNSRTNIDTQEKIKELLKVNSAMQKKSLTFQYAAGLIEFIVLAYYGLTLWDKLTHAAGIIPGWVQFVFVVLFSANTVMLTHYLAEYMQGETHVRQNLIVTGVTLGLILLVIVAGSVIALGAGGIH